VYFHLNTKSKSSDTSALHSSAVVPFPRKRACVWVKNVQQGHVPRIGLAFCSTYSERLDRTNAQLKKRARINKYINKEIEGVRPQCSISVPDRNCGKLKKPIFTLWTRITLFQETHSSLSIQLPNISCKVRSGIAAALYDRPSASVECTPQKLRTYLFLSDFPELSEKTLETLAPLSRGSSSIVLGLAISPARLPPGVHFGRGAFNSSSSDPTRLMAVRY
jgi:hypothetical protein